MKQANVFFSICLGIELVTAFIPGMGFLDLLVTAVFYEKLGFMKTLQLVAIVVSLIAAANINAYIGLITFFHTQELVMASLLIIFTACACLGCACTIIALNKIIKHLFKRLYARVTNIPVR